MGLIDISLHIKKGIITIIFLLFTSQMAIAQLNANSVVWVNNPLAVIYHDNNLQNPHSDIKHNFGLFLINVDSGVAEVEKNGRTMFIESKYLSNDRVNNSDIRQSYVDKHPDLNSDVKNSILNGVPAIGMNKESAKITLGVPDFTETSITAEGTTEVWRYQRGLEITFIDNGIAEIKF